MSNNWAYWNCLDASALVKRYLKEGGSDKLEKHLKNQPTWYATPFCLYEALGVIKRKWMHKEIKQNRYMQLCWGLAADVACRMEDYKDINLLTPEVFNTVRGLATKHNLDISDAFQIVSIKDGFASYANCVEEASTLMITADRDLAMAARQEGVRVWDILREPIP